VPGVQLCTNCSVARRPASARGTRENVKGSVTGRSGRRVAQHVGAIQHRNLEPVLPNPEPKNQNLLQPVCAA
jgi:hypothetical protein